MLWPCSGQTMDGARENKKKSFLPCLFSADETKTLPTHFGHVNIQQQGVKSNEADYDGFLP